MRIVPFLLVALALSTAPVSLAGTPVPVNPLVNGGFEAYVPLAADAATTAGLDQEKGVGRGVLGCARTANILWQEDCAGNPRDPATEAAALAADPQSEVDHWLADGYHRGDLVLVAPAHAGIFHAANWATYPPGTIAFADHDGDLDREAKIRDGNQMLYQSFGSASGQQALPMGLVTALTFRLEAGSVGGSFAFTLDAFPYESVADYPQAFHNYQLSVPASAWTNAGGVWHVDPTKGSLSGPLAGSYPPVPPEASGSHPTAAEWNAASEGERRAMLMEFRAIQLTFWNLPAGAVVDDVGLAVEAQA